jgi:hypothetical protein
MSRLFSIKPSIAQSTRLPTKSFMPRSNSEICINASEVTPSFRLR